MFGFQPTLQYPDPRPNSHFPALQTLPLPTRLPLPHKLPWHWLPRAHPTKHINALTTLASGAHGGKLGGITPVFAPQLLSITPNFAPHLLSISPNFDFHIKVHQIAIWTVRPRLRKSQRRGSGRQKQRICVLLSVIFEKALQSAVWSQHSLLQSAIRPKSPKEGL